MESKTFLILQFKTQRVVMLVQFNQQTSTFDEVKRTIIQMLLSSIYTVNIFSNNSVVFYYIIFCHLYLIMSHRETC